MVRKQTLGDKFEGFMQGAFWLVYHLYVPVILLWFAWCVFADYILPLF